MASMQHSPLDGRTTMSRHSLRIIMSTFAKRGQLALLTVHDHSLCTAASRRNAATSNLAGRSSNKVRSAKQLPWTRKTVAGNKESEDGAGNAAINHTHNHKWDVNGQSSISASATINGSHSWPPCHHAPVPGKN